MDGLGAGAALQTKLALVTPALRAASADLWRRPGLRRRYVTYLQTMHFVIRASVPLMERAAQRCAGLEAGDPVALPLGRYLMRHAAEENGHDDWLRADLAALMDDPSPGLAALPPPVVARLVGPHYYWVEHHHPVTLLGYIAVMEGNAPSGALADWIVARADVPATAVRTVREHAELDTGHSSAVLGLLDTLPLTAAQAHAVATAALHTVGALIDLFTHLTHGTPRAHCGEPGIHPARLMKGDGT